MPEWLKLRLLIDENTPDELTDTLRRKGYDISTAPRGTKDDDVAIIAKKLIILEEDEFRIRE